MNDEILFENKTSLTKSNFLDGVKLWIKSFKLLRILIYVMLFMSICLVLFNLLIHEYFLLIISLLMIVFLMFYPKIISAIVMKKQCYTFGLERVYSIYNDRIEIRVAQNKTVIPFYMIKAAGENKDNFYMIYENQIICISKKGFTIGDLDKFSKFIKSKINFK